MRPPDHRPGALCRGCACRSSRNSKLSYPLRARGQSPTRQPGSGRRTIITQEMQEIVEICEPTTRELLCSFSSSDQPAYRVCNIAQNALITPENFTWGVALWIIVCNSQHGHVHNLRAARAGDRERCEC